MSIRAFAAEAGIPYSVVYKFMEKADKNPGYPSMEFVKKLAAATATDPCTILEMVIPDAFAPRKPNSAELLWVAERLQDLSPEDLGVVVLLAKRVQKLPPEARVAIEAIVERYER